MKAIDSIDFLWMDIFDDVKLISGVIEKTKIWKSSKVYCINQIQVGLLQEFLSIQLLLSEKLSQFYI